MRLLLTSSGLANDKIKQFFVSQFDRLDNKTAGLVTTERGDEDRFYIDTFRRELEGLGIKVTEINISKDDLFQIYPEFDIYFICGGNTYYILDRMRATGMQKILVEGVNKNKFYVGVSAGSIIAGPDIAVAGYGINKDVNDLGLHSLGSFNLVPFLIFPHYCEEEKKDVIDFKKFRFREPVIALTDEQALFVSDSESTLIGERGGLQFCENCKIKDHTA